MSDEKPKRRHPHWRTPAAGNLPQGAGWGGPAKGFVNKPPKAFSSTHQPESRVSKLPEGVTRAQLKEQRTKIIEDMLFEIATESDNAPLRMNAGAKLHAIYNGMPIARQVSTTVDDVSKMSDEELRAELSRLRLEQEGPKAADTVN